MAPEHQRGDLSQCGRRTDMWSFGCLVLRLCRPQGIPKEFLNLIVGRQVVQGYVKVSRGRLLGGLARHAARTGGGSEGQEAMMEEAEREGTCLVACRGDAESCG